MKKSELVEKTEQLKQETHDALTLLYTSLPAGQRRTVVKNNEVKALLDRYGVKD